MDKYSLSYGIEITDSDWEKTPASVKELVERMRQHIKEVEEIQQELEEKVNRTSKNSSSPPSVDPLNTPKQEKKRKSGLKRGGQPGHKGNGRDLYDSSECDRIIDHHPQTCKCCGKGLIGQDSNPYRHQVVEIPPRTYPTNTSNMIICC